jgi:hypothetical protein
MAATKVIQINREKVISILNTVLSKENGTEIYIPCSSKKEQNDAHTCIIRELKIMSDIDPADSSAITHRTVFRDGRFWVVLTKVKPALNAVYIKDINGKLTRQEV